MTSSEHDPAPLNTSTVLTKRQPPHLEWIEIEGEAIAWNDDDGELHRLDPIATLVFRLCDGTVDLGRTAADLAEAFRQPVPTVEADVLHCAQKLLQGGLVEVQS